MGTATLLKVPATDKLHDLARAAEDEGQHDLAGILAKLGSLVYLRAGEEVADRTIDEAMERIRAVVEREAAPFLADR